MKYFKSYDSLLQEKLVGKNVYYFNSKNIKSLFDSNVDYKTINKDMHSRTLLNFSDNKIYFAYCRDNSTMRYYKKGKPFENPEYNYIFKANRPIKVFKKDEYHVTKLLKLYPSTMTSMNHYYGTTDDYPEIMANRIVGDDSFKIESLLSKVLSDAIINGESISDFKDMWDGYIENKSEGHYWILFDTIKEWEEVTGNALRFGKPDVDSNFEMPDWIFDELIRYTENSSKKMKLEVKEWLKENSPKPSEPIQLFRGFGIDFEIFNEFDFDMDKMKKKIYRLTGTKNIEDLGTGKEIKVKRGKESSWSYDAEIAKTFAKGFAIQDINMLVKTIARPEDIIIDFTLLPNKYKEEFKYRHQNEVILEKGTIPSTIESTWFGKDIMKWMNNNGYTNWKQGKGFE